MENIVASILAAVGIAEVSILVYLLAMPRRRKRRAFVRSLEKLNIFLALFFVISGGAFFALNGPAFVENIAFDIRNAFAAEDEYEITNDPIFNNLPTQNGEAIPDVRVLAPGTQMELVIPKLNVRAPVVFSADPSTEGVLKSLESGVGVYPGSIMPGQKGRMIVLGHSSRASWYNGDYARVFSLLEKLEAGDEFIVESDTIKYVYRITNEQVLKPAAADAYMAGPTDNSVIELVTCHPVGSAANRLVMTAELVGSGI